MRALLGLLTATAIALSGAPGRAEVHLVTQVKPIVIDDDPGGMVEDHLKWFRRVKESGIQVRVRGICASACTFVLALPRGQACAERTSSFGFHLVRDVDGEPDPGATQALARRFYPQSVLDWLKDKKLGMSLTFMPAAEAVSIGAIEACDDDQTW